MMIRADVEEIQTTRTEKLLAVVLAAFLLLGAVWTYQNLDNVVRHYEPLPTGGSEGPASQRFYEAQERAATAQNRRERALEDLELRREAYRTALEAKRPAQALERRYDAAQLRFAAAEREVARARAAVRAAEPAAAAEAREAQEAQSRLDEAMEQQERDTFFVRLGFVALFLVVSYLLLVRMRRGASRWFPLAGSVVGAAVILAFVLASDYLTDYFDPFQWGLAAISILGILTTLLVYWGLQRYILRRIPQRRVRRHQCPFCGYPAEENVRCEGCGREVVAPCATCEAPRRVGTPHCAVCGSTSA